MHQERSIALVQAPSWGVDTPPLALASLSAYARARGVAVRVFDLNHEFYLHCLPDYKKYWSSTEDVFWYNDLRVKDFLDAHRKLVDASIRRICADSPILAGFSVFNTSMFSSLMLARMLKDAHPEIFTVFGGSHASRHMWGDFILAQPQVDAVVEGEGEETLLELVGIAARQKPLKPVAGARVKSAGIIMDAPPRPLIVQLDTLPTPDFSDFAIGAYAHTDSLPAFSSRGCINRCVFCNEWPFWQRYRFRSGEMMFRDLGHQLSRYPSAIRLIEFHDSMVNGNLKELGAFARRIVDEGVSIRWSGQAVFRSGMDYDYMSVLKRSGCQCLAFGFESASQRLVDTVGKHFRVEDAEHTIRYASELGLNVVLNFMFGIPGETENDFLQTLEFVRRNRAYIRTVNPSPSFCAIGHGSYLESHFQEFGIAAPLDSAFYWHTQDDSNTFLVRLERFEMFCRLVRELGIESTYPRVEYAYRNRAIADYYFYKKDFARALEYYLESERTEGSDENLSRLIHYCRRSNGVSV